MAGSQVEEWMTWQAMKFGERRWRVALSALSALVIGIGVVGAAVAQSSSSDADFVATAAVGDIFEIESGKLPEVKASPNASRLAEALDSDHAAMLAELKALVQNGKIKAEIPAALDTATQAKLDKLRSLRGGAFDKGYFEMQIEAQKNQVVLFEAYARVGGNSELKSFAAKYLPRLQKHLKDVTGIRAVIMDE